MNIAFSVVLLILVLATLDVSQSLDPQDDVSRDTRAWRPPELTILSKYWKSYARLRAQALDRCERRLFLYGSRRKMAQDASVNVARRNTAIEQADIKSGQEEVSASEASLTACVLQIVELQSNDPFYKDYQLLISEVSRLSDQVTSCIEAGGSVALTVKRDSVRQVDEQVGYDSSPQMLRVYENLKKKKDMKVAEKTECFASLGIQKNFPYQLE
ncbi:uncharacterized protein LOC131928854 [Physella acuta]|uniref:uncharacterized protein LOC131928854 n=1 Tax=Physella acuta TaxID=109671 RepID=UPI0027DE086D|nr:uncharacterized protein LOC131928854 [Physella acuta]